MRTFLLLLSMLVMGCTATPNPNRESVVPSPVLLVTFDESAEGFVDTAQSMIPGKLQEWDVSFEPHEIAGNALRLELRMTYRNITESEFETIWRTTTLILATLYPSTCGHRAYMLTATLSDGLGHSRTYEVTDSTVAWLWLLHGAHCGESPPPEEVASQTDHMLDAVFKKMRKDKAFADIGSDSPESQEPLVHVVINRAADIAEQVLSVDRSFARWTLGDDATPIPDYRVDLHFDVRPGSFSILKGYLAIMTIGLTSPCRASQITLTATVTGPKAAMTRSYAYSDSLSGRMGRQNSCEIPDESNRPEVFAKLLRRAFRQINQDRLLEMASNAVQASLPPLVQINASRALAIVRRETVIAAPFPRYYYYDSDEYVPDYTLMIDFQFAGGGRRQLSTAGEIGAGLAIAYGVNMLCHPTSMILDAVLRDQGGHEVRRYHIERTFGFSGELHAGCQDDETTNPGAVSELVRTLYADMEEDRTRATISTPQYVDVK